jgi:hypothetical protein
MRSNGIVLVLEMPRKPEDENENEDEDEICSRFWAWFLQSTFNIQFGTRRSGGGFYIEC